MVSVLGHIKDNAQDEGDLGKLNVPRSNIYYEQPATKINDI
jgi:hypothetical protein